MSEKNRRGPVVLIVEDEALIRMDVADFLTDAGMTTVEASTADEALKVLSERPEVDIVFTDVHMPGTMDGIELANTVRRNYPEIGVIIASGLARLSSSSLPSNMRFFSKPYDLNEIVDAIAVFSAP